MPRVVVLSQSDELLLVHHNQDRGRDAFWVIPGGDLDHGETSWDAAIREVREETGILVRIDKLLWLVEEIDAAGLLRSQAYFLGTPVGGHLAPGSDPDRPPEAQVIDEARWFSREEIATLHRVYPEIVRREMWRLLDEGLLRGPPDRNPVYRIRPCPGFGR